MKSNLLLHEDVQVSSGLRFANFIIDTITFYVILFMIIFCSGLLSGLGIEGPEAFFMGLSDLGYRILGVAFMATYYFVFEATTQRTLGKYITGTMVVGSDGESPSVKAILGRSACRIIGIEAFSFLGNRRGWHDSASNTYVVKAKKWKELTELENAFDEIGEPQTETHAMPLA
jgi:uncharacterized RDD family membrane protein YckC